MQHINQKAGLVFDKLTQGMDKVGDHRKIENGAFMPLSIEVIDTQGCNGGLRISICHYGEQNGDAMRDPEICFIKVPGLNGKGIYAPYYYRNDYLNVEQTPVKFNEGGAVERVAHFQQKDIAIFAGQWAANLKEQGFIEALKAQTPSKEFKGSAKDFLKTFMGEETYKMATNSGLLIEEPDGSLRAPIKTPLVPGSSAYNFAKSEGMI